MRCSPLLPPVPLAVLALSLAPLGCDKPPPTDPPIASASPALSSPSNAELLAHLTADDPKMKESAKAIAASGDEATQRAAGSQLVAIARTINSPAWRDANRGTLQRANAVSKVEPTPDQLEAQLTTWQNEKLKDVLDVMGAIGGADVVTYGFELAESEGAPIPMRQAALAVLKRAIPPDDAAALARRSAVASRLTALEGASTQAALAGSSAASEGGLGVIGNAQVGGAAISGGKVSNASAVVAGMAAGFRRCYNRGLTADPAMQGSVKVTAKIGPNGEVTSVEPSGGDGLSGQVVSCVAARVASAQFAPPEGGGATIVIPVTFVKSSESRSR